MSVIVQGMRMPKDCIVCYETTKCLGTGRCFEDGTIWCGLAKGYLGVEETRSKCPLRPLPEKYGRLIEADSLKETLDYYIREAGWDAKTNRVLGWVKDEFIDGEQTIVEAEG